MPVKRTLTRSPGAKDSGQSAAPTRPTAGGLAPPSSAITAALSGYANGFAAGVERQGKPE